MWRMTPFCAHPVGRRTVLKTGWALDDGFHLFASRLSAATMEGFLQFAEFTRGGPVGVLSRNFSNSRIESIGWRAQWPLERGIKQTYSWIAAQVLKQKSRQQHHAVA